MKKKQNLFMWVVMTVVLVVMGFTVFFVSQQGHGGIFDLRNRASNNAGPATLTLSPNTSSNQYYVNDDFTVDVLLNTGGHSISGVSFRLTYPVGASELTVKSITPTLLDSSFTVPIKTIGTGGASNGTQIIDFEEVTEEGSGYTNSESTKVATITFHAAKAIASKTITPDISESTAITDKQTGLDILKDMTPLTVAISSEATTDVPTVAITGGPADASTVGSTAVTFSWSGTPMPTRSSNTTVPLTYVYSMDNATLPTTFGATTSASFVALNGSHTFRVQAKDPTGHKSTVASRTFTVNSVPVITSLNPVSGYAGASVTITGSNFGATAKTVKFGTVTATVVTWKDTQIVVKVPANAGNTVTVSLDATHVSNSLPFGATTTLTLNVILEGIKADAGPKTVTIVVKKGDGTVQEAFNNVTATWNSSAKAYQAVVGFTTTITNAANFSISVKELSRLRKKFTGITLKNLTNNVVTKTVAANTLLAGDFNNDNQINLPDWGLMMANFNTDSGLTITPDANHKIYDLDGDGSIDFHDITLLLTHLTGSLQLSGDNE